LAGKRAPQVKRAAAGLLALGGRRPGRLLRSVGPAEAYQLICRLQGLGPKSALCVIMYSLGADVLPVDVNVQRVCERPGAIPAGLSHYQAQRRLAAVAPVGRARQFHIGLVVHGRRVCVPGRPRCGGCRLRDICRTGREREHG
jgi:endonuclease-3